MGRSLECCRGQLSLARKRQFLWGFMTRLAGACSLLKPALSKTGSRSLTRCPAPSDASSDHLQKYSKS